MDPISPSTPLPPGPPQPPAPPEPAPAPAPPPAAQRKSVYTPAPTVAPPASDYAPGSHRMWYVIGTVVFLTIAAGALAVFLMQRGGDPANLKSALPVEKESPTPTPTATATARPAPEIVLDKDAWKFEILNGSGVSGAAAEAKPKLEELGYEVVRIGNADTQDQAETKLFVTDLTDPEVQLLIDDLQAVFPAITVSDEALEESEEITARVILGAD